MLTLSGSRWPLASDVVPAVLLAVLATVATAGIVRASGLTWGVLDAVLVVACGLALLGCRLWPAATLLVVSGLLTIYLWRGNPYGPVMLTFVVALMGTALRLPLRRSLPVAAGAALLLATHALRPAGSGGVHDSPLPAWMQVIIGLGWVAMLFAIGVAVRTRRHARRQGRVDQVRALVDAERLRMSHDVHDGVGHGLAAINMQASLGLRSVRKNPDRAEEALYAIRDSSAAALTELRAVLARLDESPDSDTRRPGLGLADVPALAARLEQAGMTVQVDGQTDLGLPAALDLAVYRVVQESLTNALRHGSGDKARVTVRRTAESVTIVVRNSLAREGYSNVLGGGRGIPGMRSRVEAVHGTLVAAKVGADFEVRAELPLTEEDA